MASVLQKFNYNNNNNNNCYDDDNEDYYYYNDHHDHQHVREHVENLKQHQQNHQTHIYQHHRLHQNHDQIFNYLPFNHYFSSSPTPSLFRIKSSSLSSSLFSPLLSLSLLYTLVVIVLIIFSFCTSSFVISSPIPTTSAGNSGGSNSVSPFCRSRSQVYHMYNIGYNFYIVQGSLSVWRFDASNTATNARLDDKKRTLNDLFGKSKSIFFIFIIQQFEKKFEFVL